jgi:hypothetical protein
MRKIRHHKTLQAWVFGLVMALPFAAHGFVVDTLSYALEGAEKWVSEKGGYTLRADFWQGATQSGKVHAIKHHLVKGNSYWFWVGTDADDTVMAIAIYDKKTKKAIKTDVKKGKHWIGARIDVPKSGSYLIAFKITTKDKIEADWAVAYAFK